MQGLTRNPLADPGILGVNAGAALFVVIGIYWFGLTSLLGYVWFAFAGAAVASVLVYTLGLARPGGRDAGQAGPRRRRRSRRCSARSPSAILLLDVDTLDQFRFWNVGSLAGRTATIAANVAPFIIVGLRAGARLRADAQHPGARRRRRPRPRSADRAVAGRSAPSASCCCAARRPRPPGRSPSSASPSRTSRGRSPAPTTAGSCRTRSCCRPILLLGADIVGRVIARPGEVQVGIVTAVIGAPVFIFLVRRRKLAEL